MNSTTFVGFILLFALDAYYAGGCVIRDTEPPDYIDDLAPWEYIIDIQARGEPQCLGAYIRTNRNFTVVTLATCVMKYPMADYNLLLWRENKLPYLRAIRKILVHSKFTQNNISYNVAILRINKEFPPQVAVHIRLSHVKYKHSTCQVHYRHRKRKYDSDEVQLIDNEVCAMEENVAEEGVVCAKQTNDTGFKKSGFLLVCDKHLAGIGFERKRAENYVFVNTGYFRLWILFNLARNDCNNVAEGFEFIYVCILVWFIFENLKN